MSRQCLHGGLITLCLLLTCRLGVAIDPTASTDLASPVSSTPSASSGPPDTTTPITGPALLAVPANTGSPGGIDAGTNKRIYTLTASLRETYDDNVGTNNNDTQSSLETTLAPSILISIPSNEGNFTARYSLGLTYYSQAQSQSSSGNSDRLEVSHEINAQYAHAFSERFNLSLVELFRYYTEPSLDQNTGTAFRNGAYFFNSFNGSFFAQWTPLFGTTTTYANNFINYQDPTVGDSGDDVENTGSQTFSYALLPKISASIGGIVDNVAYKDDLRGYSNYTAFLGLQWQALPSVSLSVRGGASYTETVNDLTSLSPYGALSLSWNLGERSNLSFDYSHEVTPSSQIGAQGQESDRVNAGFSYNITPRLSARLEGTYTSSSVTQSLATEGITISTNETVFYVDTSLSYRFDKYFDIDTGITESANKSDTSDRNYTRSQVYAGIRGTY